MVWGQFMHVRVTIDISKPLVHDKMVNIGSSALVWVRFSYERLPNFCYRCGLSSHGHLDCDKWQESQSVYE